jgi:hypothetical protein
MGTRIKLRPNSPPRGGGEVVYHSRGFRATPTLTAVLIVAIFGVVDITSLISWLVNGAVLA